MWLLETQINHIYEAVEQAGFSRLQIQIDRVQVSSQSRDVCPILRFLPNKKYFARILPTRGAYRVNYSPGVDLLGEFEDVQRWEEVLAVLLHWLLCIKREIAAAEQRAGTLEAEPGWVVEQLPDEYAAISKTITDLQEKERRLRRMGGLLWQTGEPLNRLVRDVFTAGGLSAELTKPGATYDVTVTLPEGRLLVEVTGIENNVNKGSKKISQVLSAQQTEARPKDRVCVAVNAFRKDRRSRGRRKRSRRGTRCSSWCS